MLFAMSRAFGVVCAFLALVAFSNAEVFFADTYLNSRLGASQASTSEYYGYGQTEVACLKQLNFKNCRYTGCLEDGGASDDVTCGPTNIFFQTDFSCCAKEHDGYGYDNVNDVGHIGFSEKVGTCDWEISLYKWFNNEDFLNPVLTDDNTALKFGTAWGTCYLRSEADKCDSPLCDRMAISIQGGLYASCAYSTDSSEQGASMEDTCAESFNPAPPMQAAAAANGGKVDAKQVSGNLFQDLLNQMLQIAGNTIGATCGTKQPRTAPPSTTKAAPKVEAKLAYNSEEHDEELYSGIALIISGPFYETSKHDGKIAETGIMEFAPLIDIGGPTGSHPINNWPVVKPRGAKLRFTQEGQYYGSDAKAQKK